MAEKGRIFTGARARFSINGVKVGYARNVNINETIQYDAVEVLDNIEVEEFAPTAYRVNMTASMFKIIGETVKSLGWFPQTGTNSSEHLENILTTGDLTATIEDSKTGKIVATVQQVKVEGHNYSVDSRGIVGNDVTFNAVRVLDESEVV